MPDPAQVNRSLSTIHTELEYLRDAGILSPPQLDSIFAQLPQKDGQPSSYVDSRYAQGGGGGQQQGYYQQPQQYQGQYQQQQQYPPGYQQQAPQQFQAIAQQAQDPGNPAHPQHKDHAAWAKNIAGKFGNYALMGAGATFGADLVNDAMHKF